MNELLISIKDDLLSKRLLPYLAALGVALVAALAYVALGGGGSSSPSSASTAPGASPLSAGASHVNITQAPAAQTVAEMTGGSGQHEGISRNPFTPLPGSTSAKTASPQGPSTSSSPASSGSSTGSTGGSGSQQVGGSAPSKPAPAQKPSRPTKSYSVAVLFGVASTSSSSSPSVPLTPYEDLAREQKLPSAEKPLLSFGGVESDGQHAKFALIGEAPLLQGVATCLPSDSQCQSIALAPGQAEQLQYLMLSGETVTYELKVVSIAATKAKTARAHVARRGHRQRRR